MSLGSGLGRADRYLPVLRAVLNLLALLVSSATNYKENRCRCTEVHSLYFLKKTLFIFREREGREKERNIDWLLLICPHGDAAWNPGTCPDLELNW